MTLQLIVFIVLALFIAVCSVLAVTTSRILRAATYLLFVLFGTAGIYFQLNYSFLGAVQLLIYAGGITVLTERNSYRVSIPVESHILTFLHINRNIGSGASCEKCSECALF